MADPSSACTDGDPDCYASASNLVASSISRLFTGDFSSLNDDFLIAILFLGLCMLSWQLVYYLLGKFNNKIPSCPPSGRFQYRSRRRMEGGLPMREQHHRADAQNVPEDARETDIRAAGDSWDQDEFDPDYDANNEIMVMLLQENPDDENSDEGANPTPPDYDEDSRVLHRIIMARSDDEARILALGNEDTTGRSSTTPPTSQQQSAQGSNAPQNNPTSDSAAENQQPNNDDAELL